MAQVLIGNLTDQRAIISFDALLVQVTARTLDGDTGPVWIGHAIRVVSTRVLPDPAPARINADCDG